MNEKPILFSTENVRAILDGRKTQTRRILIGQSGEYKGQQPIDILPMKTPHEWVALMSKNPNHGIVLKCRFGQPGGKLWVRETWASDCVCENPKCNGVIYKAGYSGKIVPDKWQPSIFMPRWASRITLEIINIRVQRINCMTNKDAHLEGVDNLVTFMLLWDRLNKKRGYEWKKNCWVWVLEFQRV